MELITLLVSPCHSQKHRGRGGEHRVVQVDLHKGSHPRGLKPSPPFACQMVHPDMGWICLEKKGPLLQFTPRHEALDLASLGSYPQGREASFPSLPNDALW